MGKRRRQSGESRRTSRPREERTTRSAAPSGADPPAGARFEDKVTIFWMMSTVFALAGIVLGLAATAYAAVFAPTDAQPRTGAVLEYARVATALVSLILFALTPVVLWLRRVPPPRAITLFVLATATVGLGWALFADGFGPGTAVPREAEVRSDGP